MFSDFSLAFIFSVVFKIVFLGLAVLFKYSCCCLISFSVLAFAGFFCCVLRFYVLFLFLLLCFRFFFRFCFCDFHFIHFLNISCIVCEFAVVYIAV